MQYVGQNADLDRPFKYTTFKLVNLFYELFYSALKCANLELMDHLIFVKETLLIR